MRYDGIIREILYYGEKSEDGRWIIPVGVDWDFTITSCSSWVDGTMDVNMEALEIMKRWTRDYNVGWILDTMRPDDILGEPLDILRENGVELYGVRRNPQQKMEEPKVFAVLHLDDRNIGTPLMMAEGCDRPCVDWKKVDEIMSPVLQEISDKLNES